MRIVYIEGEVIEAKAGRGIAIKQAKKAGEVSTVSFMCVASEEVVASMNAAMQAKSKWKLTVIPSHASGLDLSKMPVKAALGLMEENVKTWNHEFNATKIGHVKNPKLDLVDVTVEGVLV